MASFLRRNLAYLICWLYPVLVVLITRQDPFFWDTVQLASKHAHFFYENQLHWGLLPAQIDSGHPPFFGYYLAICWTVFGKTLAVSHWAMLPFLLGLTGILLHLGQRLLGRQLAPVLWLIAMADPVLAGQSTLVSPDIPLLFFFLLALSGILDNKALWVALGVLGLGAISMRGMMSAAALGVWMLYLRRATYRKSPFRLLADTAAFLPGLALAAGFLIWHQQQAGWTGYHPDSPWAPAFEPVHGAGIVRNVAVLGWRWLDLGRFFAWALLAYLFYRWKTGRSAPPPLPQLVLWAIMLIASSPTALIYAQLSAHRYFLPAFLSLEILTLSWLAGAGIAEKMQRKLVLVYLFCTLSGNFWIYPRGISMDWDATLAARPYYDLRARMLAYLDEQKLDFATIGTTFPSLNTGEDLMLNGDLRRFAEKNFNDNRYILASNIFNDFKTADYKQLESPSWRLIYRLERHGIWMQLYQKE